MRQEWRRPGVWPRFPPWIRAAGMSLVSLHNVSKNFGSLRVIDNLSMHLEKGEALGIIGPNGAGKSTIFNIITGDLRPDQGRVQLDGADASRMAVHDRCRSCIGRTYQIPHPFAKMSVFENLVVGAAFGAGNTEREAYERCVDILERTNLLHKANVLAGSLTLLERKRLELARALATNPKVLLLDEIGGGLNDDECLQLVEVVKSIHRSGVSIIWIEHIVHALVSAIDRLVVINFGQKLADGNPHEVMKNPAVLEVYMGVENQ